MKYRIRNGLLLLFDGKGFLVKKEDLFIDGAKIASIGADNIKNPAEYTLVDANNQLIMPGLINSHTHVYMNFMKNSADDLPLHQWLQARIFPIEAKMEKADFYWATLLGCVEMIKTGTTCFLDMHICEEECSRAARDAGMRAFIGKCITGTDLYSDGLCDFEKALREKAEYESELLRFVLSPHSVYACSDKLLFQIAQESEKRNMLKHIHLSESDREVSDCFAKHSKTPVGLLRDIGFLNNKTIAAHCTKVTEADIVLLAENGVSVATNPSSNAKLGNGTAPVSAMLQSGVRVCLGTDSAASNNTLNLFREMGIFSVLHKAVNKTATQFTATEVLKCAILHPAEAFGMCNQIGVIKEGAYADLIFIDLATASLFPNNDIIAGLCYSANGSEVKSVMINGSFIMRDRMLTALDTERIYYEIHRIVDKYI
ncbi:MAG: amidohydrolase [Ruminococcaceae bacterium]|nr:amidohydrolase [Oscillospiraceae bacterium]